MFETLKKLLGRDETIYEIERCAAQGQDQESAQGLLAALLSLHYRQMLPADNIFRKLA